MGRINWTRVVLGGLLAGLVINVSEALLNGVVLARQMSDTLARFNLPEPGGGAIAALVLSCFALGIAAVWLYAAIRPRYGAGVNTALCAGSAVWFTAYVFPSISLVVLGFAPAGLTALAAVWGLAELLLSTVAGAWIYRE